MRSLFYFPAFPPGLSMDEYGAAGSASGRTACPVLPQSATSLVPPHHCKSSPPRLPVSTPLPVWMNVSSLTPWLSDFHTVLFSVSSGCFLFLNCCPSFGCGRRHSVSTYSSILAGTPMLSFSMFVSSFPISFFHFLA